MTRDEHVSARVTKSVLNCLARKTSVVLLVLLTMTWGIPPIVKADEAIPEGDPISDVLAAVEKIVKALEDGLDLIDSAELDELIASVPQVLAAGLPIPPAEWESQLCPAYRMDLKELVTAISEISGELASFTGITQGNLDLDLLIDGLDLLPCIALFPSYVIFENGPFSASALVDNLIMAQENIGIAFEIMNPSGASASSASGTGDPIIDRPFSCEIYDTFTLELDLAKFGLQTTGIVLRILGTILKAAGKTVIAGPTEAHAAAWGWAGATIKHNTVATLGTAADGLGGVLVALGSTLSGIIRNCKMIFAFEAISEQIGKHDTDTNRNIDDHDIAIQAQVQTHDEDIKALLENIIANQFEMIRLLVTPHGQRSTDIPACGGPCDFPGKR